MAIDARRLRNGEVIAAVSGLVVLVAVFALKWFALVDHPRLAVDPAAYPAVNAWHALTVVRFLLLLAGMAGIALAVISAAQRTVAVPVSAAVITSVVGIVVLVVVAVRVLVVHPGVGGLSGEDASLQVGAYLGVLGCLGVAVGGWRAMADERTSPSQAGDSLPAADAQRGEVAVRPAPPANPPTGSDGPSEAHVPST